MVVCSVNGVLLISGPDSLKKAPFLNKSPSDLHCQFLHKASGAPFRFVTFILAYFILAIDNAIRPQKGNDVLTVFMLALCYNLI